MESLRIRGNIVNELARIETYLNENVEEANVNDLKVRQERLPSLFEKFLLVQDDIEIKATKRNLGNEQQQRTIFEERYYELQSRYRSAIDEKTVVHTVPAVPNNNIDNRLANDSKTRLPPISLPKFDGVVSNWCSFHDTFKSLIHDDPNMDLIRKFHYLKSCLTGEASNIIDSIPLTADNYENAWKMLIDRYNNKKLIINFHLKGLFNQSNLKSENSLELCKLIDNCNKHIRALRSLNIPIEHWDTILIYMISNKFDSETKKYWDLSLKNEVQPTYNELEQFVEKRCFALSNLSQPDVNTSKSSKQNQLSTHHAGTSGNKNKPCNFCQSKEHKNYRCPNLLKLLPKDRFQLVKKRNLCIKCFGVNHSLNDCKFFDCKTCHQKHNTLLHFTSETVKDEPPEENETTSNISNQSNKLVILATALVRVKDSCGNYQMCRALLDSGSQSNFLTRKFADRLKLKLSKSTINITGINSSSSKSTFSTECNVSSHLNTFSKNISFIILKNITSSLPSSVINTNNWSFMEDYTLADPTFALPGKIDMLIGAEVYEDIFMNDFFKPSEDLPTLRNTVFGWVVIGKVNNNSENLKDIRKITALHSVAHLSDNGTNFVGAKNVLESLRKYVQTNEYKQKIGNWMSSEFINWHNIPAYAPHMGGLWEAGIKSVKTHLKTLTVNIKYTFEELYTLLTEIEACLNSRPLSELSSDPNDLECLTPGHFLIGAPLSALPERNILDEKLNFNKRWDLIKRVNQHFWKRWSLEYVSRLQTRFKWKKVSENLKIGDMVIIKNEFSSPLKWPLGRVITLHTGKDNCVRVVTVKTKTGVLTRSINLLVPLPFIVDNDQPGGVC